ncbi:hypothetical protein [Paragemmobacter straminiformis]|uniref:Uncharacterized protein n=1 Tax=Paragemmobacter straminiformis TaxID=2045119 RepID=A0A842I2S5_9RHOB|nr:hypothetical protein [Gemmobacter straminiformis]MBC2834076.1 hypothetical protein [Gemmobacter straminiformis]
MSAFSAENVAKAISRVTSTSSKDLRALRTRAVANRLTDLAAAIDSELQLRGAFELDASQAERHASWSEKAADLNLVEAIEMAFSIAPANPEEKALTLRIYENPEVSYQDLVGFRGKGDVGLILGHMIYERLGFFRKFLLGSERMSDLLFTRDTATGRVSYRLTAEAEAAFIKIGLLGQEP